MKKITRLAAFVVTVALVAPSCSKYEEGPGLTLRTKKGRLAGDWTLSKMHLETSFTSGDPASTTVTLIESEDGAAISEVETSDGSILSTKTGTIEEKLSIEKDGSFTKTTVTVLNWTETTTIVGIGSSVTEYTETKTSTINGIWNFTSGVGDAKNKQHVVFRENGSSTVTQLDTKTTFTPTVGSPIVSTNSDTETDTYSDSNDPFVTQLEILLLKNKEVKFRFENDGTYVNVDDAGDSSSSSNVNHYEVTYKQ